LDYVRLFFFFFGFSKVSISHMGDFFCFLCLPFSQLLDSGQDDFFFFFSCGFSDPSSEGPCPFGVPGERRLQIIETMVSSSLFLFLGFFVPQSCGHRLCSRFFFFFKVPLLFLPRMFPSIAELRQNPPFCQTESPWVTPPPPP